MLVCVVILNFVFAYSVDFVRGVPKSFFLNCLPYLSIKLEVDRIGQVLFVNTEIDENVTLQESLIIVKVHYKDKESCTVTMRR